MKEAIKKIPQRKKWKVIMLFVIGILCMLLTGNIILNRVIQNKVSESLAQLSPFAKVTFSSISANLLASSLSIKDLSIQFRPDTIDKFHQHLLNFPKAQFSGIDFLK